MIIVIWVYVAIAFFMCLLLGKLYMINTTVKGVLSVGSRLELMFWLIILVVLSGGLINEAAYEYLMATIFYLTIRAISTITEIVWLSRLKNKQ